MFVNTTNLSVEGIFDELCSFSKLLNLFYFDFPGGIPGEIAEYWQAWKIGGRLPSKKFLNHQLNLSI
jgi:hypothetical protein